MSLCIDDRPVVTPSMAYEEKGGNLNVKKQYIYKGTHFRMPYYTFIIIKIIYYSDMLVNIDKLHIENFKSIRNLDMKFNKINAIVGPNNAGKSNIMRALSLVLGETWPTGRSINDNDYFNRDVKNTIKIEVMFDKPFLDEKSQQQINGFRFECHKEEANFFPLDAAGNNLKYANGNTLRVSSGMREEVPLIYVDIDRQSSQQVRATQWTLYGKILKFLGDRIPPSKKKQFKETVLKAFNSEIFSISPGTDLMHLEEQLNKSINEHTGLNTALKLDILDPVEAIKNVRPYFIDHNTSSEYDPEEMGAGTQSALSVAIAKAYGDIVKKNVLLAIEEPELHLHPQACKNFYNNLQSLSENEVQVIYTTHSQYFVDFSKFDSLHIVRKKNSQTTIDSGLGLISTGIDRKSIATKFNDRINQTLFADTAILVEGPNDEIACKAMLEKLDFNIDKNNVSVVACGGIANIAPISTVLCALHITTMALVDEDPENSNTLTVINKIKEAIGENSVYIQSPNLEGIFNHTRKFEKTSAVTFFENYEKPVPDIYHKLKYELLTYS